MESASWVHYATVMGVNGWNAGTVPDLEVLTVVYSRGVVGFWPLDASGSRESLYVQRLIIFWL